jgi:hypothetical protein
MPKYVISLLAPISPATFTEARHQFRRGNIQSNPLTLALAAKAEFALVSLATEYVIVRDLRTGLRFSGTLPKDLADYLAHFKAGRTIRGFHQFELMLSYYGA